MEANQYLNDFYNHYDEDSRLLFQHGSVEFLTTMRYIEKYLKHGDKVLEIGAGTGRYSHALARRGHPVDAVELVAHNIEVFRQNTRPGESVTIAQGNALDLSAFADNAYDVTLLLGPLYHLYTQDDKRRALREAIRVTKPGGVVFAAYVISDGCLLDEGFRRGNISVAEYVRDGLLDARTFAASSQPKDLFELVRKEDVDELMSVFPVTRLHYVASDGCALLLRDEIDAMDADAFALYLKYHFATCERADLAGITSHAVDIFRKLLRALQAMRWISSASDRLFPCPFFTKKLRARLSAAPGAFFCLRAVVTRTAGNGPSGRLPRRRRLPSAPQNQRCRPRSILRSSAFPPARSRGW